MTLSYVAQVAQTISSVAVVISLIFVGIQLHQNTKATRAASHHAVSDSLNRINLLWARNKDAAHIWLAGMQDRGGMTVEERWRFDSMLRAYLHVCETMYTQAALGAGDPDIVVAEEGGLKFVFASTGARAWWKENPFGFSHDFRRYIDETIGAGGCPTQG